VLAGVARWAHGRKGQRGAQQGRRLTWESLQRHWSGWSVWSVCLCSRRHAVARRRITCAARLDDNAKQLLLQSASVDAAERSPRLRPLHALSRGAELPRPHQQRTRQGELAAARGQQLAVPVGLERLQSPAPERWQRTEPRPGAAGESAGAAVLPVRAQPRPAEFSRPRQRRSHTRSCHRWNQSGFAKVRGRKPSLREVPAPYMPSNAAYNSYARTHG
jgi:hypothetical protein